MQSLQQIKDDMLTLKPYLVDTYGVKSLYIFGSYARSEQTQRSDLDILVDFKKVPDLLEFIEMEEYLSKQLKTHVDLVPKRKLKPQIKEQILQEAIA
jgi:predicted nucleotidyltransferase